MLKLSPIKFLVDESVEFRIVLSLRKLGFDVTSVSEENPSISDSEVIKVSSQQKRVLITNDKGFGGLVFKEKYKSHGVILIRLPDQNVEEKILRLDKIIQSKAEELENLFTTITEKQIRSKQLPNIKVQKNLKQKEL